MATIGSMVIMLGLNANSFEKSLKNAQRSLKNAGRTLNGVGQGLTLGLSAPLAGIATVALASAADFETAMNTMGVVSGATGAQMQALQAQALDLGAKTSFSAGEAAQGMLELAKAGMSVEQVQSAIGGTMNLAAAGSLDLASAAEITANSLNAYGLAGEQASMVADVLAAAANSSSVEVTDMADSFKMVGAVAAMNKISFQDTATALALLGNNAIKGSDAGTGLKTMIMRLTAPTADAAGVMANFGISIYDTNGDIRPFVDILGNLNQAFAGVDDATRNAAYSTLFGADAIKSASILIDSAGGAWDSMSESVNKSGAASDIANARMKGLGGAIEYFKGTIDSLLIGSALPFMATLSGMVRGAADFLGGISSLPPQVQQFGAVLLVVVAAAGPLLMLLGTMATALAGLLSPIGLVIAAVALLGVAWATNFGGIRDATDAALQAVAPFAASIVDWFSAQIPGALAAGQSAFAGLAAGASTAWAMLMGLLEPGFARIQSAFAAMPSQMAPLQTAFGGLIAAGQTLWTALQPIFTALGEQFGVLIAINAVQSINLLASAFQSLIPVATIILTQLIVMLTGLATITTDVVTLVVALLNRDWDTAWTAAGDIFVTFFGMYKQTIDNLLLLTKTIFKAIFDFVINTLDDLGLDTETLLAGLKQTWYTIWGSLKSGVQPVIDAVGSVRSAIESFIGWIGGVSIPNPFAGFSWPAPPAWWGGDAGQPAGTGTGRNALGTPNWPGGWTWVGERGPELVNLRAGSQIQPLDFALAGAGGNLIIESVTINNGMDVEELAYRVFQARQKKTR